MKKQDFVTPATRALQQQGIAYVPHSYKYIENGGTKVAAEALQVEEHKVVKTLVMQDSNKQHLIVLMHGNKEVSEKKLARVLGEKSVKMCSPQEVNKLTGYVVGGTSPFGIRNKLPVYIEESILELPEIWINAGKRGLLLQLNTQDVIQMLQAQAVNVARDK